MGIILPWQDIRRDRVPSVHDFHQTASEIMQVISANTRVFKGAAFVGSLPRGDVCVRSDLDMTAVAFDGSFTLAKSLIRDFEGVASGRGIPLDCHLWSSSDARLGRHPYGPSYTETFPRSQCGYVVGRPLGECFRVLPGRVSDEMVAKMLRKERSTRARAWHFMQTKADRPDEVERWLVSSWMRVVRPMRVHVTLGRRLLWWHNDCLPHDGKADVIAQFMDERAFGPFHDRYHALCELDSEYDCLLARACAGNERRGRYLARVSRLLRENFRVSLDLLSSVTSFMKGQRMQRTAA